MGLSVTDRSETGLKGDVVNRHDLLGKLRDFYVDGSATPVRRSPPARHRQTRHRQRQHGERNRDHLVSRSHPEREKSHVQGAGARVDRDRLLHAAVGGELFFERLDLRSEHELA